MPASPSRFKLLIISRDTLLDVLNEPASAKIFRSMAGLSRRGLHVLLSAAEPDRWVPTRGNVDSALNSQKILMEKANEAGGGIEGVYYVPRSLLTQDRNREGAIQDILKRYSVQAEETILISSNSPFIKAAIRSGISTYQIALPGKPGISLAEALSALA